MMSGFGPALDPFTKITGGTSGTPATSGTAPSTQATLAPEACTTNESCVANKHYWWRDDMLSPPTCHAFQPAAWYMEGGNQLVMAGIAGIAVVSILGYFYFVKK